MSNKKNTPLSFEPVYHRRVSRNEYTLLNESRKKSSSKDYSSAIIAERNEILSQGFHVVMIDKERPFNKIEESDKGDVVSVLANTNPLFRLSNS